VGQPGCQLHYGCSPRLETYRESEWTPNAGGTCTLVCERDPEPPSIRATRVDGSEGQPTPEVAAQLRNTSADRLARVLDGDLDSIVLMAMRKEPGRRYQSGDMLRQDVERYLAGLPVLAHQGRPGFCLGWSSGQQSGS
jgi:hypothetical protein